MHRPILISSLALGLAAMTWMPAGLRAQAPAAAPAAKGQPSTSDTYLQGYLTMVEGEKLKKNQDYVGAYYKFRDARDTFDAVHAGDSSWNPEIIDYRRRKIRENMEEVRQLEIQRRAAGGAPSPKGLLGSGKEASPSAEQDSPPDAEQAIPSTDEPPPPRSPGSLMEEKMRALLQQIARLEKRNEEILKSLGAREEELRRASKEKLESQNSEKKLKERLIETQTKLETAGEAKKREHRDLIRKVEELGKALEIANAKLVESNASRDQMASDLANALGEIKTLTAEVGSLRKERDQMMALLSGDGGSKGIEKSKIIEENQRLKKELAAAQAKMEALAKDKDADRAEIASLKEEVRTVQESLTAMQQENEDYRQQIAALTNRLDATRKQLADSGGSEAIPESEAIAENNVLREIILQQMKQQARRERARQNVMDELTREGVFEKMQELGVESENLLRSVNEMAAPVMLSKDQRDIITSTQVNKLLTSADGKELYIVEDSSEGSPLPDVPADPSGAPDKAGLTTELKAYANAAEENFLAGDFSAAENNFRKILLAEPQNVYALCNLGVTQLRLNSNEEAAETLLKALAYNYENDFAHYARGVALLRTGRLDDAVEELQEGLKINDKNAAAWHTQGLIAIKRGQREQARAHFLKAVEIDTNCAEAHFNLAVLFATSNPIQIETARRHYRMALSAGAKRDSGLDKLLGSR